MATNDLDRNQAVYESRRTEMEEAHLGQVALLHDGEIVEVYNDKGDAYKVGCEKYGLGNFSLVNVGERPINLGYFTIFTEGSKESK